MPVSPDQLAAEVATLVRIPSVNPLQSGPRAAEAGPIGERALAEYLAGRFGDLGATEVILDEVVDGRPNVYGLFPGTSDRVVVIDAHTDTVTVEHMTDPPFDGRIDQGAVWGRGALDTKATMGVMLALLSHWKREGLRPTPSVWLVGTVSEESGGLLGAKRFAEWVVERGLKVDQIVAAEPTELAPIHGHKGGVSVRVTALGTAAHSALPELGANAIEALAHVITAIEAENRRLTTADPTTALGTATVSVTMIKGGSGGNVIPAKCSIVVNRRTVPGEDSHEQYERLVTLATEACPLPVRITPLPDPGPGGRVGANAFYTAPDARLIQTFTEATGQPPRVAPFGTNALHYTALGCELVVFGPGAIDDAHLPTERVSIADLTATAAAYTHWLAPT